MVESLARQVFGLHTPRCALIAYGLPNAKTAPFTAFILGKREYFLVAKHIKCLTIQYKLSQSPTAFTVTQSNLSVRNVYFLSFVSLTCSAVDEERQSRAQQRPRSD